MMRMKQKRVAYYYNQPRLPKGHSRTNPYGPSLAESLEKLGYQFEFSLRFDVRWLFRRRKEIQIIHWNWPSYQYKLTRENLKLLQVSLLWFRFVFRLVFARLLGYRIVWTMHNLYPHNRRFRLLDHCAHLVLCVLCHSVIVHCEHARRMAASCFGRTRNVHLIPHGNFVDVYPDDVTPDEARRTLEIPPSDFVYLFFGSIQSYKGLDNLIKSFQSMPDSNLKLMLVGAAVSSYAEKVSAEAERDGRIIVRVSQRTPSDELQYYFNAADVVVLPFTAMLTSGSVILAMSWRKPVIVPSLGCLPELLTDRMGIMYDPAEYGALRKAMADIRSMDCRKLGETGYRRMRTLNWDVIARLTHRAYQ